MLVLVCGGDVAYGLPRRCAPRNDMQGRSVLRLPNITVIARPVRKLVMAIRSPSFATGIPLIRPRLRAATFPQGKAFAPCYSHIAMLLFVKGEDL